MSRSPDRFLYVLRCAVISMVLCNFPFQAVKGLETTEAREGFDWKWGVIGGLGYFNFRDSLFLDRQPDPPGNLGDDWSEIFIKPWVTFENNLASGTFFAKASWAYVRTNEDAADIAGGGAESTDMDELYLAWQTGAVEKGRFTVAGGRYSYQIAHGFLLSDGYSDGGSRGGLWSNARTAWAPGGKIQYQVRSHTIEGFHLERDERPESDSETEITGMNYEFKSSDARWVLGASWLSLVANELASQRDGAEVWNLRAYIQPFDAPLTIEAEWADEDNGLLLDSTAWYIQPNWTFEGSNWQWKLYYRYAIYQGDDPHTVANEAFDPLFPAFHDWGSWWQGEIAGEYFLSNSNLRTHMLRLHAAPTDNITTGLLYFDYKLDQKGSYHGGVSSSHLGQEINWYLDWQVSKLFKLSFILARNKPGKAVKEAFERTKDFKYGMVYLGFSY